MGTRSIIKIEGCETACVYKHWDGNPEHMLPWLEKFNEKFIKERGDDAPYKLAQLIRSSASMGKEFSLDDSTATGWGVYPYNTDCGQAYEYKLMLDGRVTVK